MSPETYNHQSTILTFIVFPFQENQPLNTQVPSVGNSKLRQRNIHMSSHLDPASFSSPLPVKAVMYCDGGRVDMASRVAFPLTFVLFAACYWLLYNYVPREEKSFEEGSF